MSQEASAEEAGSAPEMPRFEVETTDRAYATEFRPPQRITVPASGERVTLTLGSVTVPARLITRAAPAVEEAAYLIAEITPPDGIFTATLTRHQSLRRHSGPYSILTPWTRPGGRVEEISEVSPNRMRIPVGVAAARKPQLRLKRPHTAPTMAAGPATADSRKPAPMEIGRAHV